MNGKAQISSALCFAGGNRLVIVVVVVVDDNKLNLNWLESQFGGSQSSLSVDSDGWADTAATATAATSAIASIWLIGKEILKNEQ